MGSRYKFFLRGLAVFLTLYLTIRIFQAGTTEGYFSALIVAIFLEMGLFLSPTAMSWRYLARLGVAVAMFPSLVLFYMVATLPDASRLVASCGYLLILFHLVIIALLLLPKIFYSSSSVPETKS